MRSKLFVTFMAFLLLLLSETAYCWREDNDNNAAPTEVYYSSDDNNYSDNYRYDRYDTYNDDEAFEVTNNKKYRNDSNPREISGYDSYLSRLPKRIATNEKTIVIDPHVHAWGAYNAEGILVRAGLATAGAKWCSDIGRPCRTKTGVFRIQSLGDRDCISKSFPVDVGGAPMPYCMYFNGGQALHGSNEVREANVSHGCVRIHIQDAQWLRFDFANIGTKVIVKSY